MEKCGCVCRGFSLQCTATSREHERCGCTARYGAAERMYPGQNGRVSDEPIRNARDCGHGGLLVFEVRFKYCYFFSMRDIDKPSGSVYYPSDGAGGSVGDLPTVVYIHGGGYGISKFWLFRTVVHSLWIIRYIAGAASLFNGEDIIRQSNRGVVVVIIQYRLGIFGKLFLCFESECSINQRW